MKLLSPLILSLTAFLLISSHLTHADKPHEYDVAKTFAIIEKHYSTGYCDKLVQDPIYSDSFKRDATLLALEDVLMFTLEKDSYTLDWVKNINTFQIARKPNKNFVNFVQYADRSDVAKIIAHDLKDINSQITSSAIKSGLSKPEDQTLKNKAQEIINKSKAPVATLSNAEAEAQIMHMLLGPSMCATYQIVMDEQSAAAIQFQDYAMSVNKRALHKNIKLLQDLAN